MFCPKFFQDSKKKLLRFFHFCLCYLLLPKVSKTPARSFASISILRGGLPEIKNIMSLIDKTNSFQSLTIEKDAICAEGIFPLRSIGLAGVHYVYPGTNKPVLNGINIDIPIGSRVAFVGPSAAGKQLQQIFCFLCCLHRKALLF